MKKSKKFTTHFSKKKAFFSTGKNEVVELNFETNEETKQFERDFYAFEATGFEETKNKELKKFWEENRFLWQRMPEEINDKLVVSGAGEYENILSKTSKARGFASIEFTEELNLENKNNTNADIFYLIIQQINNKKSVERNVKTCIKNTQPFFYLDLSHGSYAVAGPFCIPRETACPFCIETRATANDLLFDFHDTAIEEIPEFFNDKFFVTQACGIMINLMYLEISGFGRGLLQNSVRNISFFSQTVTEEGVLPYPSCECSKITK